MKINNGSENESFDRLRMLILSSTNEVWCVSKKAALQHEGESTRPFDTLFAALKLLRALEMYIMVT